MHLIRFVFFLFFTSAGAVAAPPTFDVNRVEPGGLYFATDKPGRVVRAPTLKADVEMVVTGPIVHTRVTQHYENIGDAWVEGIYTYPLPKGSTIDMLKMQVGERIIEGEIQEKKQAERTFDRAAQEGRRASLVIQRRPNIFSTRIANIGPGETVQVTIEYQDLIEPRDNIFELRFPMVVRPRYNPGLPLDDRQARTGWGVDTDQVPDGSTITPPWVDGTGTGHNPVSLKVSLNPGFEMMALASPSHEIAIAEGSHGAKVTLASGDVPADQDFILRWRPRDETTPRIGLFEETTAQGAHQLLMLIPPTVGSTNRETPARELVIVLDRSGSMGGQAIRQAKSAVRRAVMRLTNRDTFNIIAFSSRAQPLFPASRAVTDRTIDAALDFVSNVEAGGGTEMSAALAHALKTAHDGEDRTKADTKRLKQIIFVTDGAVGNEAALMGRIKSDLGDARLFTVGIGSAPNSYFMSEAAHFGRGTFINIAMQDDVMDKMAHLFAKIERPQLSDIRIEGLDDTSVLAPSVVPDMYDGEPIVIAMKDGRHNGNLTVRGNRDGQPWSMTVPKAQGDAAPGVANLWARRRIQAVNRSYIGQHDADAQIERRDAVLKLALDYHLVSDFTSLVAVERQIVRDPADPLYRREVPVNLPDGMDWAKRKRMTISRGLMSSETMAPMSPPVHPRGTATPMILNILIGLSLLLTSSAMFAISRRKPTAKISLSKA